MRNRNEEDAKPECITVKRYTLTNLSECHLRAIRESVADAGDDSCLSDEGKTIHSEIIAAIDAETSTSPMLKRQG